MSTETCVLTNIVTTTTTVIPIATDTVTAMGITIITTIIMRRGISSLPSC